MHSQSSERKGKSRWEIFMVEYGDRTEWRVVELDEASVCHDDALFSTEEQAKDYKTYKEYNGPT